jgi:hypothetical protein
MNLADIVEKWNASKWKEDIIKYKTGKYDFLFHSDENIKNIISMMNNIRLNKDPYKRRIETDGLTEKLHLSHLNIFYRYLVRETTKDMVRKNEDKERKFGNKKFKKLSATHPLSVAYLLSTMGLEAEIIMAAVDHDEIEDEIKDKKENNPNMTAKDFDIFTADKISEHYSYLKKILKESKKHLKKYENINPERADSIDKKLILYSCIITQKVTRKESDENFPNCLDTLTDTNISINNPQLRGLFLEYLNDIKRQEAKEKGLKFKKLTDNDLDKKKYRNELTLSTEEIHNLIVGAWFVKLADRFSNTKDTHTNQPFSDKINDISKNFLVIDSLRDYLKKNPEVKGYISREKYEKLQTLADTLISLSKHRLNYEISHFEKKYEHNISFNNWKKENNIDEKLLKYKKDGGFRYLDSKKGDHILSGFVAETLNKALNKDEEVRNKLNTDENVQYLALKGLQGVFDEYIDNPNFTIKNMDVIKGKCSGK